MDELLEPLSEEELEALRLTASHPAEVVIADGSVSGEMPNLLERRLLATIDALAQPTAAREAAAVGALKATLAYVKDADGHAGPGEGCSLCSAIDILNRAIADTSPAAAALLAQGEETRDVLRRCLVYIEGTVTARSHESDRGALNRVRSELLNDGLAALAPGETE